MTRYVVFEQAQGGGEAKGRLPGLVCLDDLMVA